MILLHWNARSLVANGQELKGYIEEIAEKPEIICIQETWLKTRLEFVIKGYVSVRRDRQEGNGGGCGIFIKQDIQYKLLGKGEKLEYIVIEVWEEQEKFRIINFYNSCKTLLVEEMGEIIEYLEGKVIWCGDFNANSTVWGKSNDKNGQVLEEVMEMKNLVCINDGRGTRINIRTGMESNIDLTIVSNIMAGICEWNVDKTTTIGSDHYPIIVRIGLKLNSKNIKVGERYNFNKADWNKFRYVSQVNLERVNMDVHIDELNSIISKIIIEAADVSIKKIRYLKDKKIVPWWTNECKEAIKLRNKAFKVLKQNPIYKNLIEYKSKQAIARRTVKNAKREYWRNFCGTIGRETKIEKVWRMIKRMNGKKREFDYPVLKIEDTDIIRDEDKVEVLAKTFNKIHSSNNIDVEGRKGREDTKLKYKEIMKEDEEVNNLMNVEFTKTELNYVLKKIKNTAPGKDQIWYKMIQQLNGKSKDIILKLYNKIWEAGKLPMKWKESIIIPIAKPGKDNSKPGNYRPIALTSNLCKIMEKMINNRIVHYLNKEGYLSKYQSGFRKGRSTSDPTIYLEYEIRKAQVNKESVVAVFFDIEKAYDMMWVEGLLIKLYKMGIKGKIFNWIKDFLANRKLQVRIGEVVSGKYVVENGTPQGSIISPVLFSIMINDVFKDLGQDMGCSLFADDGAVWKRGKNVEFCVKKLQEEIYKIEKWAFQWGFKFSVEKSKVMLFTQKKTNKEIKLTLYNQELEQVKCIKFLGVWFDEKLIWKEHIQKIVDKCKKILNIMRCLVGSDWGADRKSLKHIYVGMIRANIDFGCIVYGSAAKAHLLKIDNIQHQALRLCTGAFKTTPTAALEVEMGEMPLDLRRTYLEISYWLNLQGNGYDHPNLEILRPCWEKEKKEMRSFGWMIEKKLKEFKMDKIEISQSIITSIIPPWVLPEVKVDMELMEKRQDICSSMDSNSVQIHLNNYYKYLQIYTDASKINEKVGIAYVVPEFNIKIGKRLTDNLSVYTGEMMAILLALQWVEEIRPIKTIICSDSSSVLLSLKNNQTDSRTDILMEIMHTVFRIQKMGLVVVFVWVPAHIGVLGNEMADRMAKREIKNPISIIVKISKSEGRSIVKEKLMKTWQNRWDRGKTGRWFHEIQKMVGERSHGRRNRKEERVITRLRFGHSGLNFSLFKIIKHKTGKCEYCGEDETIKHCILECNKYENERRAMRREFERIKEKFDLIDILRKNMGSKQIQIIMQFLKRTKLFQRI
uniref:Reverse transcriptase domain-containing protein n=1 Tax=Kryptolebias marmoratus TaxID=37003 RepID=A0A3Q2ZQ74_KRYMA